MLLYPRTLEDDLFRWLKVNVNETTEECKLFICPGYKINTLCSRMWASLIPQNVVVAKRWRCRLK